MANKLSDIRHEILSKGYDDILDYDEGLDCILELEYKLRAMGLIKNE